MGLELRDGDIYRWRFRDEESRGGLGRFGAYHCKSQIAVCENGTLYDTFWGRSHEHTVRPENVYLELLGNSNEMTKIRCYDIPYYKSEDIVDTRHSNSRSAPIYLKANAQRDAEAMLAHIQYKLERAEQERDFAEREIQRWSELMETVQSGDLEVFF